MQIRIGESVFPVYSCSVRIEESDVGTVVEAELDGIFQKPSVNGRLTVFAVGKTKRTTELFCFGEADLKFEPTPLGTTRFRALVA